MNEIRKTLARVARFVGVALFLFCISVPARADSPTLTGYVLEAMKAWARAGHHPVDEARFAEIAEDIVAVVNEPNEPSPFAGDTSRVKIATLLASIAFHETGFAINVDQGRCRSWECDHGIAFSLWQLHPQSGIVLLGDEWVYAGDARAKGLRVYRGQDLVANRRDAIRVALHVVRKSVRSGARLCQYTAELGPCPKGDTRYFHATGWVARHPYAP